MRLLGNCSAVGRSGGCMVPRHALVAVDGEGRTVPTSLHCHLHRDQSSAFSLSYDYLEERSMGLRHGKEASCSTAAIPSTTPFSLARWGMSLESQSCMRAHWPAGKPSISSPQGALSSSRIRAMRSWPGSP